MSGECVQVLVRCRGPNSSEIAAKYQTVVEIDEKSNQIILHNPQQNDNDKTFAFDQVFSPTVQQSYVYENSAFSLVQSVFDGYNGTMFAYGQTGCGKTFTMTGVPDDEEQKGVIPRTFSHIISVIQTENTKEFLIRVSFIEIYNEEIHDLLGKDQKAKFELKQSPDKGVYVKDLSIIQVKSIKQMEAWMTKGTGNRHVGETNLNRESSRSHSIFTIYIEVSEQVNDQAKPRITAGKLNLVDLAGSERQSQTGATGERLKEANKINLSLSALGNVISALVDGKSQHIPYRDSKLTRLLQDSLGGNTQTIMLTAISPVEFNYDETMSTLRYASRAQNIQNKPKINEDPKDALLKQYAEEIRKLKEMLEKNSGQKDPQAHPHGGNGGGTNNGNTGTGANGRGVSPVKQNDSNNNQQEKEKEKEKIQEEKQKIQQEVNSIKQAQQNINKEQNLKQNELKQKRDEIQNERKQREDLMMKIKELQAQKLKGSEVSQNDAQKQQQLEIRQKIKDQIKMQEQLQEKNQRKEEEMEELNYTYSSLQDEVVDLRAKVKKLKSQYKQNSDDIKDVEKEHQREQLQIVDSIRSLEKQNLLDHIIISLILSQNDHDIVRNASEWNDTANEYEPPPLIVKNQQIRYMSNILSRIQAMDLVQQDKINRQLEFGVQQKNQLEIEDSHPSAMPMKNKNKFVNQSSSNKIDTEESTNNMSFYGEDTQSIEFNGSTSNRGRSDVENFAFNKPPTNQSNNQIQGTIKNINSNQNLREQKRALNTMLLKPIVPGTIKGGGNNLPPSTNTLLVHNVDPSKNKSNHNKTQLNPIRHYNNNEVLNQKNNRSVNYDVTQNANATFYKKNDRSFNI